jgi:hypothetical protein
MGALYVILGVAGYLVLFFIIIAMLDAAKKSDEESEKLFNKEATKNLSG